MRILLPTALLLLASCGDPNEATREALAAAEEKAADDRIECAPAGAEIFTHACKVERVAGSDGTTLTVHHPDGGFRRLLVTNDGRGVIAADGAEPALVTVIADNRIEVALAGNRYRLPATVKGAD